MTKRGQITLFIIMGIVIVILLALVFFLRNYYGFTIPPKEFLLGNVEGVEGQIKDCVDQKVPIVFNLVKDQGGYLTPVSYRLYGGRKVSYLCNNIPYSDKCLNNMFSIEELEKNMEIKLTEEIRSCVDVNELRGLGYDVVEKGQLRVDAELLEDSVLVKINYPIELVKGDAVIPIQTIEKRILDTPLKPIYRAVYDIVDSEAKNGYFFDIPYMLTKQGEVIINIDKPYPDTVYIVNMKGSEFKFYFAIEGEE